MPYGTVNADVIQTSTSGGILGAGNASIMKNRIINGAMMISQYNGTSSATPVHDGYSIDRYKWVLSQASKVTTQQSSTAPTGFINSMLVTSSAATTVGTSDYFSFEQDIEGLNVGDLGWGTASAKTVCLSFQVYSSLTGTFGGALRNSSGGRSYPFSYTISSANTWTQISVTVAGDTSGTWLTTNGIGLRVNWGLGVGSTYSGTAGAWNSNNNISSTGAVNFVSTSGATFYITAIQLEVGANATGFEYRMYGTELMNCQRYFYRKTSDDVTDALVIPAPYNLTATNAWAAWWHPVTMRAIPTYSNGASFAGGSPATVNPGIRHLIMQFTNGTWYIQGITTFNVSAEL